MLDGTDVDAQIMKKRAHKFVLAETLAKHSMNRFRMKGKRKMSIKVKPKPDGEKNEETPNISQQQDTSFDFFGVEFEGGGYIIESGNVIAIDMPALNSVNKFANNVIQHSIIEHYDVTMDEDTNFNNLRGNLLSALEKNATTFVNRKISNMSLERRSLAESIVSKDGGWKQSQKGSIAGMTQTSNMSKMGGVDRLGLAS